MDAGFVKGFEQAEEEGNRRGEWLMLRPQTLFPSRQKIILVHLAGALLHKVVVLQHLGHKLLNVKVGGQGPRRVGGGAQHAVVALQQGHHGLAVEAGAQRLVLADKDDAEQAVPFLWGEVE